MLKMTQMSAILLFLPYFDFLGHWNQHAPPPIQELTKWADHISLQFRLHKTWYEPQFTKISIIIMPTRRPQNIRNTVGIWKSASFPNNFRVCVIMVNIYFASIKMWLWKSTYFSVKLMGLLFDSNFILHISNLMSSLLNIK